MAHLQFFTCLPHTYADSFRNHRSCLIIAMPKSRPDQSRPKRMPSEPSRVNSSQSTKNNEAAFRLVRLSLFFWWIFFLVFCTQPVSHQHDPHSSCRCPFSTIVAKATQYNVPVKEAIEACGATCGTSGLYSKVKRWRDRERNRSGVEKIDAAAVLTPPPPPSTIRPVAGSIVSSISSASSAAISTIRKSALSSMPSWLDKDTVSEAMAKRKKRTPTQTCQDNFDANGRKKRRDERYKSAFKSATILLNKNMTDPNKCGKRGYGAAAVATQINKTMLTSPNDRKVSKTNLYTEVVLRGQNGKSPPVRGRPCSISSVLPYALATHSAMMQVSGEGEASAVRMKTTLHALVSGTPHENKFNVGYAWRRTRKDYPEVLNPVRAKGNEDRRVDWLTFKNIHEWNSRAKHVLVNMGMLKDEIGEIRK